MGHVWWGSHVPSTYSCTHVDPLLSMFWYMCCSWHVSTYEVHFFKRSANTSGSFLPEKCWHVWFVPSKQVLTHVVCSFQTSADTCGLFLPNKCWHMWFVPSKQVLTRVVCSFQTSADTCGLFLPHKCWHMWFIPSKVLTNVDHFIKIFFVTRWSILLWTRHSGEPLFSALITCPGFSNLAS
jgi:hypothetical protein